MGVLLLLALSCMKGDVLPDSGDEYNLIITGLVMDHDSVNSDPIGDITVTLQSHASNAPENDPGTTETVKTAADGTYRIIQRFNEPAYMLSHILHFVDENGVYKSEDMTLTVHKKSLSRTEHGYLLEGVNAALDKK